MSQHLGELAALATAMFFAASSTVNTLAGRKVGSNTVNQTRLALAIVWLVLAHWLFGISLPTQAGAERWLWLSISGVIGLAIGDALLFQSFIMIGPRLANIINPQAAVGLSLILSGMAIIIFLIFEPRGIAHLWERIKNNYRAWPF